ncbi:calcium:proton antiporter [Allopusillimonas soli]|uniref:calcium:proton antiporter n=1 Tax=Allopusillimonas soli TaxID=659016 RepID=UPI001FD6B3E8|nr:calcium:proton antiporter [Allopusillimonas soli]
MTDSTDTMPPLRRTFREEYLLAGAVIIGVLAYACEHALVDNGPLVALAAAAVLVAAIVGVSLRVAHHAEILAEKVGDPYGSMILTLSAVLVEVVILGIMVGHEQSPTLVRDTIYAAVMLDINGILGLAALMGGLKHGEQSYNDDSGRVYGVMILTAMGISMIVPEFIPEARRHIYAIYTIGAMLVLYSLFVRMQVGAHSYFFSYSYPEKRRRSTHPQPHAANSSMMSAGILVLGIVIIGALAEVMSKSLNVSLAAMSAPPMLAGLLVATISACPEILTALRAALANRMQSVVNIAMGASLSTVILTVPAMEALSLLTGKPLEMAMTPVQTVMVAITLFAAAINLNDGQTNAIEGMTHFILFTAFLMLTALGL